jgi:hypothetical protein
MFVSSLEQDDFSLNRHPALALCLSMSFFAKPVPTFAGHALARRKTSPVAAWPGWRSKLAEEEVAQQTSEKKALGN